ncbi:hypothetical protein N7495_009599 [Penicillium taxi]|uniref:uncharacterized protein n=1 Tax=Penicillium taxi TaxID=168475 RepID=UPI002545622B|nr:uncharacterized protein N7495_009599 [Penicillium taxi]KAJ5885089.1 hypothetical protein N7495_009599 [Penicillium taxi]
MAQGDSHCPVELDGLYDRNRSGSTICLPSTAQSPLKHVSTYNPKAGHKDLEKSNQDPFYLEQALAPTPTWDSYTPEIRNDSFSDDSNQYYLPSLNKKDTLFHQQTLPYADRNRPCTLAELELENSLRFHRYTPSQEEHWPLHCSQNSFSSVQSDSTVPDLTPSSSFSSKHSYYSPSCPNAVLQATEKLYYHARQDQIEPRRAFLAALTPAIRPITTAERFNNFTFNLAMKYDSSSMSSRRKQHPTLPDLARSPSSHSPRRKHSSQSTRPPLDPSMISPPCLINPVTMEPHATHFDQALFIPANDFASPIPSPVASSPPISRQWTAISMERPSMSTIDVYCEQSVWESDSDSESIGPKSISRKPIDTLRKVRSRAKLRAAKSQPKLRHSHDTQISERFPCTPEDGMGESVDELRGSSFDRSFLSRPSTSRDGQTHPLQTLRLVAPSNTSLQKPLTRKNSIINESDLDQTAAAALQAKSRRRQLSDSPEYCNSDKERLTSLCYEETCSNITTPEPVSERPFFRRLLESLRFLNCARPPNKSSSVTTL